VLYKLKGGFQKIATKFAGSSMTANHASVAGVLFFLGVTLCFYFSSQVSWLLLCIPILSFFRFIANALDGLLARLQDTASPAGEVINEMSDVFGDTISYGILFVVYPAHSSSVFVFIIAIWFCELAGIMAKNLPNGVRGQESVGGAKPERAVFLSLYALYLYFSPESATSHLSFFLYALSVLVFLSGIQRVIKSIQRSRGASYTSHTSFGD
jgi:phosphatidylglycerophosphate synthase